jgi:RNA polymerase sigma-70 factor (ECF subfamily)
MIIHPMLTAQNCTVIEAILRGDEEPLRLIYTEYQHDFITWSTGKFNCTEDRSREIFQECVVALYDNIRSGRLKTLSSSLKTYLFAVGRNKFMEWNRNKQCTRRRKVGFGRHCACSSIEKTIEQKEKLIVMAFEAVDSLNEPCRSILIDYYINGFSLDELTMKYAYNQKNTTKTKKYKCLKRLQRRFKSLNSTPTTATALQVNVG